MCVLTSSVYSQSWYFHTCHKLVSKYKTSWTWVRNLIAVPIKRKINFIQFVQESSFLPDKFVQLVTAGHELGQVSTHLQFTVKEFSSHSLLHSLLKLKNRQFWSWENITKALKRFLNCCNYNQFYYYAAIQQLAASSAAKLQVSKSTE